MIRDLLNSTQRPVFMTEMWYNQAIWMAEDVKHERNIFKYPEGVNMTSFPPQHALTMVQEPTAHVVSQYFHCTESVMHRRKEFVPDKLLEWLVVGKILHAILNSTIKRSFKNDANGKRHAND